MPGHLKLRARVLAAKALAKAAHALAYFRPHGKTIKSFDAAMMTAIWRGGPTRAPEMVNGLLVKGHQTSFAWKAPLATLAHHLRLLRSKAYRILWEAAFLLYTQGKRKLKGVLFEWKVSLGNLGWVWRTPYEVQPKGLPKLHLLEDDPALW